MNAAITGTGSAFPQKKVTNFDLEQMMDTNDAWIRERTGIGERRISTGETATELASAAAKLALLDAGKTAKDIDLILAATSSADCVLPCLACEVQHEIGAEGAACFDVNAACTGFIYALSTACAYVQAGIKKTVLIVAAELMSRMINWKDRSTAILFGDGAGAAVVEAVSSGGIFQLKLGADGSRKKAIVCRNREIQNPWIPSEMKGKVPEDPSLCMDGKSVYQFAVTTVPEIIREVLHGEHADWYLLHQANKRIIESAAKRLKEPIGKFPMNIGRVGNMSAASIPVLLDELHRNGRIKAGEKLVLAGFGAGLTYGAVYMEWTK